MTYSLQSFIQAQPTPMDNKETFLNIFSNSEAFALDLLENSETMFP